MTPAIRTLRRRKEVRALFECGQRFRGRYVSLVVAPSHAEERRALFVTGRKLGGAAIRNRVRRRLREAYRSLLPVMVGTGDVAVLAHPAAGVAGYSELVDELRGLLARAGLLRS